MWKHAITRKKSDLRIILHALMYILIHCSTVNTNHHATFYKQKYHIKGQTTLKPGYSSDYADNSAHSLLSKMDTLGGNQTVG